MRKKIIPVVIALSVAICTSSAAARRRKQPEVRLTGFVDTSYVYDYNGVTSQFRLDQVELDIEKAIPGVGLVRADINFLREEDNTTAYFLREEDDTTTAYDETGLSTDDILEQGFVTIGNNGPMTIQFGKFNAPIGFEQLDPPDMFQYSHAMIFENGLPRNLTGANLIGAYGPIRFNVYMVNGWDTFNDNNDEKTLGGRLGFATAGGFHFGVSYISGKEGPDTPTSRPLLVTVYDFDLTWKGDNMTFGAEYNRGSHEESSALEPGLDAKWNGYLVMLHLDFNPSYGFTFRYDTFNDLEGAQLDKPAVTAGLIPLTEESRQSFTLAPSMTIGEGFTGLLEYRRTLSNRDVFVKANGTTRDNESTLVIEGVYSF